MTQRIHIVGSSPRTGTTLLTELMRHGFEIDGFTSHEERILRAPAQPYRVYLTKAPSDVLIARTFLRVDPNLSILHMVRDPRDVVVSRHGRSPTEYWTNLGVWKRYRSAARRAESHPRFLTLRYEDLGSDPDAVQQKIAAFMPFLEFRRPFSEVHHVADPSNDTLDALGSVRPVSTSSVGAWREHKPRLAAQIRRHGSIDRDLRELGYESDTTWHRELADVVPANGKSHLSERTDWEQRWKRWRKMRRKLKSYKFYAHENARSDSRHEAEPGPFAVRVESTRAGKLEVGRLGSGPVVVAIPPLGGAGTEHFGPLAEALAQAGFQTLAVNLREVGGSRGPLINLTLHDLAEDIFDVVKASGSPVYFVGTAFGNRVARAFAQSHPEWVRSMVLVAAGGKIKPISGSRSRRRARRWPRAVRAHDHAGNSTPLESWWSGGRAALFVIQGLDDRVAPPENGRALAKEFPERVRLLELEGVGHGALREQPDVVIPAIVAFLEAQQKTLETGAPEGDSHPPSGAQPRWRAPAI